MQLLVCQHACSHAPWPTHAANAHLSWWQRQRARARSNGRPRPRSDMAQMPCPPPTHTYCLTHHAMITVRQCLRLWALLFCAALFRHACMQTPSAACPPGSLLRSHPASVALYQRSGGGHAALYPPLQAMLPPILPCKWTASAASARQTHTHTAQDRHVVPSQHFGWVPGHPRLQSS